MSMSFDSPNPRDPLSDSGVMRILGDYEAEPAKEADLTSAAAEPASRYCPRCREPILASARVCVNCNLYLASSEGSLQTAYRAIRRQLRLPPT